MFIIPGTIQFVNCITFFQGIPGPCFCLQEKVIDFCEPDIEGFHIDNCVIADFFLPGLNRDVFEIVFTPGDLVFRLLRCLAVRVIIFLCEVHQGCAMDPADQGADRVDAAAPVFEEHAFIRCYRQTDVGAAQLLQP